MEPGSLERHSPIWLRRSGHEVLLVEHAPRLRSGGYLIDFWGGGFDIAEKMGSIPQSRALGYQIREVRQRDEHGAELVAYRWTNSAV